jgi:hypothetical protein
VNGQRLERAATKNAPATQQEAAGPRRARLRATSRRLRRSQRPRQRRWPGIVRALASPARDHAPTPQVARAAVRCSTHLARLLRWTQRRRIMGAGRVLHRCAARRKQRSGDGSWAAQLLRRACGLGRLARQERRVWRRAQAVGAQPRACGVSYGSLRDERRRKAPGPSVSPLPSRCAVLTRHAGLPLRSTPAVTRLVSVASTDVKKPTVQSSLRRHTRPRCCASLQHQLPLPHVVSPLANELRSGKEMRA